MSMRPMLWSPYGRDPHGGTGAVAGAAGDHLARESGDGGIGEHRDLATPLPAGRLECQELLEGGGHGARGGNRLDGDVAEIGKPPHLPGELLAPPRRQRFSEI